MNPRDRSGGRIAYGPEEEHGSGARVLEAHQEWVVDVQDYSIGAYGCSADNNSGNGGCSCSLFVNPEVRLVEHR